MNDPAIFDLNWDTIQETCEASPLTDWEPALRRLRAQYEKDQAAIEFLRNEPHRCDDCPGGTDFEDAAMSLRIQHEKDQEDIRAAIEVLRYVSRGRRFVDVEPYPDAKARMVLGGII